MTQLGECDMEGDKEVLQDGGQPCITDPVSTEAAATEIFTLDASDLPTNSKSNGIHISRQQPSHEEVVDHGLATDQKDQLSPEGQPAEASAAESAQPVTADTVRVESLDKREDRASRREGEHQDKIRETDKKDR